MQVLPTRVVKVNEGSQALIMPFVGFFSLDVTTSKCNTTCQVLPALYVSKASDIVNKNCMHPAIMKLLYSINYKEQ